MMVITNQLVFVLLLQHSVSLGCEHLCQGNDAKDHLKKMASQKKEVWMLDQRDTREGIGGGLLYVYDVDALDRKKNATVIDLAEAAEAAACPIARRPHMMSAFDVFYSMKYVVISNVGSGDIQVLDTKTKKIIACLRTLKNGSLGGSVQNHYAEFTIDGKYIIVVDIGGRDLDSQLQSGYLHTVKFDCVSSECTLTLIHSLALSKYTEQLQTTLARPICGGFDPRCSCHYFYLTLSEGGFIIANFTGHSMEVLRAYGKEVVKGNGCGGARRFRHQNSMITNAATTGRIDAEDYLYLWNTVDACRTRNASEWKDPVELELPKHTKVKDPTYDNTPYGNIPLGDTHGVATCVPKHGGKEMLLTFMRLSNEVFLVDPYQQKIVKRKSLANHAYAPNPTPDIATLLAEGGDRICFTMRGTHPVSVINKFVHSARTPGIMCLHMAEDCRDFTLTQDDFYPTANEKYYDVSSDPHSILLVVYEQDQAEPSSEEMREDEILD